MNTKPAEPTVAAIVREQTGVAWSRARKLCAEGRVTVNGERRLDPASRVPADAVVVVDEHAPTLRAGPLAKSAIVFSDRDIVIVDKPAGMLSVADEPGNKETLVDYTRAVTFAPGSPCRRRPTCCGPTAHPSCMSSWCFAEAGRCTAMGCSSPRR